MDGAYLRDGPLDVVLRQIDACRHGEMEQFLACFSADAIVSNSRREQYRGRESVAAHFGPAFEQGWESLEVIGTMAVGEWAVTHERARHSDEVTELLAGYRVRGGQIVRMVLLRP